ncbi:MAG: sigma-70 family RNA polymerase sigma factor [Chitinophagaceae bacterium]|nr:sigma-70 family RNA polymerase sigma factor [Chitinophagaceae bacterium]
MLQPPDHTDHELFSRVQSGDTTAFDKLYERHYAELYKDAYSRLRDQPACKDIVQDVFLDLWQRAGKINNDNIIAYLHTAVRYQVFRYVSKNSNKHFYKTFEEMGGVRENPQEIIDYKDLLKLVDLWIETLPPKRKEIFILHYRNNLSTKEIAARLSIAQKSVQNQLGIAFSDLRDKLPELILVFCFSSF